MAGPHYPGKNRKTIEITPDPDSKIEILAPQIVRLMKEHQRDAQVHFPYFTLDVPQDASAADIIKAYRENAPAYLPALRPVHKPGRAPRFYY